MVEIIIGSAIMLVGILAISVSFNTYLEYSLSNQKNVEATYLLQEGIEVMTFFRDKGWTNNISRLSTTTTYYLTFSSNTWATSTSPQYVDGLFLRSINVYDVRRDANDDIAVSGTYDSNIKLVTATVSYFQGKGTTTKSMSKYIVNIK